MALREPIAKLPLTVRKNVRDKYEDKITELRERMAKLGFPEYAFVVNVNQLYAYAEIDYTKNNTGACIYEYFEQFIGHVDRFTKSGKDAEAVETLKKVASKNTITLLPDQNKRFSYCGCDIKDGQIQLYFHPEKLGYNISEAGSGLPKVVDVALDAQGGDELPIGIRRSIAKFLVEKGAGFGPKLEEMFGKPIALEADIAKNYAYLKAHSADLSNQGYIERLPELVYFYFEAAVNTLEYKKFGKDDMLQEGFNEAADKGVIRFEVVDKLQHGNYNDCVFEDGELKLQTTTKQFASNISQICDSVLDRL